MKISERKRIQLNKELKEAFKSEDAFLKWFAETVISKRPYKIKIKPESPPPTEWEQMDEALKVWREITSARAATKSKIL